jgi:hypothetical protein
MKKVLFLITLVLTISAMTFGQLNISKGIKAGLNFATVGGSDVPSSTSSITQFTGGVFIQLGLPLGIVIQPEALYSVQGAVASDNGATATGTYSYLDIPVLIKYNLPLPVLKLGIFAGPSLGILLSANNETQHGGQTINTDIKSYMPGTDLGVVFGAGAELPVIGLTVDARYNLGLTSLDNVGNANVFNRVFSIMVGVIF